MNFFFGESEKSLSLRIWKSLGVFRWSKSRKIENRKSWIFSIADQTLRKRASSFDEQKVVRLRIVNHEYFLGESEKSLSLKIWKSLGVVLRTKSRKIENRKSWTFSITDQTLCKRVSGRFKKWLWRPWSNLLSMIKKS